MNNEDILKDTMLPEVSKYPELYNDVSRIMYDVYRKPMGAELNLVISYVILKLKERGKLK